MAKTKEPITQADFLENLEKAEYAFKMEYAAARKLIEATKSTRKIAIQIGSILVLKIIDPNNNDHKVFSTSYTEYDQILDDPEYILEKLAENQKTMDLKITIDRAYDDFTEYDL